jgi:lipoprotein LprG
MARHRTARALMALAILAGPALVACSSGGSQESAPQLLSRAKTALDSAKTAHFVLNSTGAPTTGTALTGGEGDFARPSSFKGALQVVTEGAGVTVNVVSTGGTFYAQLPLTTGYSVVDPATFGFGDPGALLDPDTGISQLLAQATGAKLGDEKRIGGEVVREVSAELPGELVQQILTSKNPSKPVKAHFLIATDNGELRRAELIGPFFSATADATFTLNLSDYGSDVTITAPPTG